MDTLQEQLDRSFGDGPPLPPVTAHVAAGRRALVRRRVASSVGALAAVTVLATGWYAVSPGATSSSDGVAGDPTPSATPSAVEPTEPTEPTAPAEAPWTRGELIRYVDEELEIRPGVVVHERIRNPYGFEPPRLSDALDVTWRGERQWLMIVKRPSMGISSSAATPSNGWASFADYVNDQVDVNGGSGWPDTFELDAAGQVVPTAGTRVYNRTDDPQLGPTFAAPGATTGAAVVSVDGEQGNYFVVWRVVDGRLDVITTPPPDVVGATFDELLTYARSQYASGEGLR